MAYRNKTYVIFDADNDIWAYGRMKGWDALPTVPFNFADAHDLGPELTYRASEATVKRALRQRFSNAKNVIVLVGQSTRNLYRYVRWELEVAIDLDLPIIAVNLTGKREINHLLCPPIIRDEYVVHIPFKLAIIKYALGQFPAQYSARAVGALGPLHYPDSVYQELGLPPETITQPPIQPISPPPLRPVSTGSPANLFSPPGQTLTGLPGYLSSPPPLPPPNVPPLRSNSLTSLLCAAPIAPPSPPTLSLADLMNPTRNPPPPPFPWLIRPKK